MVLDNSQVTPFTTVNVGGGTWDYGTDSHLLTKDAWSNYQHKTKDHSSSVRYDGVTNSSGRTASGTESLASCSVSIFTSVEAFWSTDY